MGITEGNIQKKPSSAKKSHDASDKCWNAIHSFSLELQESLMHGLIGNDKSKFDLVLNALKIDVATRNNILLELKVRPGVPVLQVEQLITKAFKVKVNTLRSLGLRMIQSVLADLQPTDNVGKCMYV